MSRTRRAAVPAARRSAALVAALAALTLAGCAEDDEPLAPDLETEVPDIRGEGDLTDPYTGDLDAAFREDLPAYHGQEVTLDAQVEEVFTPEVFSVVGPEGTDVAPLLVVATGEVPELSAGMPVTVAATPTEEFLVTDAEEELGTDLPDEDLGTWEGETYLEAAVVEASSGGSG